MIKGFFFTGRIQSIVARVGGVVGSNPGRLKSLIGQHIMTRGVGL